MKILTKIYFVVFCTFLSVSAAPLRDVPSGHWAKPEVDKLVNDYGFMQGDPNGYFGGNRALSRYEFAKTIGRMIEYYNQEINSDRKDIENKVSIMELFQKEMKGLETKFNTLSANVEEQNQIINEINDIAIALGEEMKNGNANDTEKAMMMSRMQRLEYDIDKLQNKGLVIDTLVKGTFNDIKKIGRATARVVSRRRTNVDGEQVQYREPEPVNVYQDETIMDETSYPNQQLNQQEYYPSQTNLQEGYMPPSANPGVYPSPGAYQNPNIIPNQNSGMYNPYDVEIMEDLGQ